MPSRRHSDAELRRRDPITEAIALRWLRAEQEIVDAINARASSAPQSPSRPDQAR
jgi:hypothetical protein